MSDKVKEAIKGCEEISETIMSDISDLLTKKKIKFTNENESEIIIKNKTKDKIKELVLSMDIEPSTLKLLIQITESNGNVYIRQKFI